MSPREAFRHLISTYHPHMIAALPGSYENISNKLGEETQDWAFVAGIAIQTAIRHPENISDPVFIVVAKKYPSWIDDFTSALEHAPESIQKVMSCTEEGTLVAAVRDSLKTTPKDN